MTVATMSVGETPLEDKNWNFGKRDLMGFETKSSGSLRMMVCMWWSKKPWFLKKETTESGLSGVVKWMRFDALRASCGDKPQLLVR